MLERHSYQKFLDQIANFLDKALQLLRVRIAGDEPLDNPMALDVLRTLSNILKSSAER